MKYIRVTARCDSEEPENSNVETYFPINGVELAIFIPIVAAPNARLSHGNRYPEYPNTIVSAISATPINQFSSRGFR